MPPRRNPSGPDDAAPASGDRPQGNTLPAQGDTQEPVPRMPHEHDESADSQPQAEASAQKIGKIAQSDVERGLVDTDRGPVLDEAYRKAKR